MLRPFALILLTLLSACASARPVPTEPVARPAVEAPEPLDPAIRPLSQEEETL